MKKSSSVDNCITLKVGDGTPLYYRWHTGDRSIKIIPPVPKKTKTAKIRNTIEEMHAVKRTR